MASILRRKLTLSIVILISTFNPALAQQPNKSSNRAFVVAKLGRFTERVRDLGGFKKSLPADSGEQYIASRLYDVSTHVGEYAYVSMTLFQMYDALSCSADRTRVQPMIKDQLSHFAGQLGPEIDLVDKLLTSRKDGHPLAYFSRGLATSGAQMEEDLREFKSFLESVTF